MKFKCATGLMRCLGGGKDLGFLRPTVEVDPCKIPPFYWRAYAPDFWPADDLVAFLESTGWKQVQVLGQALQAW